MKKNILLVLLIFAVSQVVCAQKSGAQSDLDSAEKARQYKMLGNAFAAKCKTDSMFFYYSKALDIYRQSGDTAGMSSVVTYIGVAYKDLGFKKSAKGYFRRALRYDSLQNDYLKMAVDFQHWAELSEDKNEAVGYLKKSIAISDTIKDKNAVDVKSQGYKNLANRFLELAYEKNDKTYADSCAECLKKLENYEFIKYKDKSYLEVQLVRTRYLIFIEKYKDALEALTAADKNSDSEKWDKILFVEYYRLLSEAYEKTGDYRNALANYKIYDSCQSKIVSDSVVSAMVNYKTERVLKYRQYKTLKEKESFRIIMISVAAGIVLFALVIFYIIRTIRLKRHAATAIDRQNEMLDTQRSEIDSQRSIILRYGHDVEFFSQQLYNDIHYAEKIQKAANSSQEEMKRLFPDSFVYYSPRDISSGDFYHVFECGKYSVLVVGDCTGYGVQGALLSLLCLSEIGRICASETITPAGVVEGIKNYLKSVFPGNSDASNTDGIVLSVLFFDFAALELRFAAVNQAACILRDGEIIRLKGDHVSFGGSLNGKSVTEHVVKIKKGDMLYAFTDGILSQPGGGDVNDRNGKKFLTTNLDKILKEVCSKGVQEQCDSIKKSIKDWRKGRPQIDDITIAGVRV